MNDLGVIDRFLDTFARYIDSGFGLLQPEVAYLSSTLVVIDVTLAALFWAMGGEEVMPRLVKKILYVGAFAFIIGNFNWLASIVFRSFAGLGLKASGASIGEAQLLQPGRLATVGVQAAQPMLDEIGKLAGFPSVFTNIDTIVVLFVAWIIVIVAFFILAVQLFVSVLEFKLTTLAGFVLVPFALWNRTSFLAEKVLGNVVASGIKVLVLAVIVGIGTGLFSEFESAAGAEPTISDALAIVLASVSLLGLGIFGPGIANGLVSGAPQLGAGSAVGTAAAGAGLIAAGGMGALAAGRAAGGAALGATRAATSLAGGARAAYAEGAAASGATGMARAGAGVANVARSGASAAGDAVRSGARRVFSGGPTGTGGGPEGSTPGSGADGQPPAWASRLRRGDTMRRGVETAAHTIRSADHGGAGQVWDERLGSARVQARNWRAACFGALALSGLMGAGLVWQAGRSSITPYVVEVTRQGDVRAVGAAAESYVPSDAQIANHLARFVGDVRSLPLDPVVVRQNWLEAYDYATDRGAAVLNDYARANDPFGKVGKQSAAIEVTSVVRASPSSFQVRWIERRYENAALTGTERWTAILSIVVQTPRSEAQLRKNPLGIYVNGLNWSRELGANGS